MRFPEMQHAGNGKRSWWFGSSGSGRPTDYLVNRKKVGVSDNRRSFFQLPFPLAASLTPSLMSATGVSDKLQSC